MVTTTRTSQEDVKNAPDVVELVSRPATTLSGLSRYADTLARYLQMEGIPFHLRPTQMPRYLRPLAHVGNIAGYDLPTFFENYPIGGEFSHNALYHLTSESLASLLVFQSLKPSVVTVHGFFSYLLRDDPELRVYKRTFHRWFDTLALWGLRRANHLICVSHYLKDVLVEQIGIPSSKVTVVYEAVDHETFYPAPVAGSFYRRFGLSPDRRYVLYVGSEQPRKNFLTLLRAFARLRRRMPDLYLLKVGRAEYEQERQKALRLIDELGLRESVLFVGHVSGDLPDFYRLADVFVFPSLYEGFGFPPLEAMACGTPVVSSNTTSLPEVVGDAALLFNPLDEEHLLAVLARLLSDEALQKEYRRRGLENARRFHWQVVTQQTVEVYRHVFEREAHSVNGRARKGGL